MTQRLFKAGQTVYTINNKTNEVDEWNVLAGVQSNGERRYLLFGKKGMCALPAKCIYSSIEQAREVIKKYPKNF